MEGLVDPRIFESRTGFLVGVALLFILVAGAVAGYLGEKRAGRRQRAAERAAGAERDNERTRRAA